MRPPRRIARIRAARRHPVIDVTLTGRVDADVMHHVTRQIKRAINARVIVHDDRAALRAVAL